MISGVLSVVCTYNVWFFSLDLLFSNSNSGDLQIHCTHSRITRSSLADRPGIMWVWPTLVRQHARKARCTRYTWKAVWSISTSLESCKCQTVPTTCVQMAGWTWTSEWDAQQDEEGDIPSYKVRQVPCVA